VLVAGGESGGRVLSAAERYASSRRNWSPTGAMPYAVSSSVLATLLPSGEVLVVGMGANYTMSSAIYDPVWRTWRDASMGFMVNRLKVAVGLTSGKSLVTYTPDNATRVKAVLFDPEAGSWSITGDMNASEGSLHTLTLLPSGPLAGKVLAAGAIASRVNYQYYHVSELYDVTTGTWTKTPGTLNELRVGHTATLLPSGEALVVGGHVYVDDFYGSSDIRIRTSSELFDPAAQSWSKTPGALAVGRTGHTATLLKTGKVLVVGGLINKNSATASAELYDPGSKTWSSTGSMSKTRTYHTATLLPSGKVLVAGGTSDSGSTWLDSAELYDPAQGSWTSLDPMWVKRKYHAAVALGSGAVLVAGGVEAGALVLAEVYEEQEAQAACRPVPALPAP